MSTCLRHVSSDIWRISAARSSMNWNSQVSPMPSRLHGWPWFWLLLGGSFDSMLDVACHIMLCSYVIFVVGRSARTSFPAPKKMLMHGREKVQVACPKALRRKPLTTTGKECRTFQIPDLKSVINAVPDASRPFERFSPQMRDDFRTLPGTLAEAIAMTGGGGSHDERFDALWRPCI